ncbi:MAG: hypothetical protein JO326_00920, partial [Acetobacteraceae bacterium]|nr:hypothetical protein [Acetobacteraceae bacterium]
MLHLHDHNHHHDHDHDHDRGDADIGPRRPPLSRTRLALRIGAAAMLLCLAVLAASSVIVPTGEALVVTEFGAPVRVLTAPGLAWKLPAPVQATVAVDLRLRTTSTGLQDVGTRDGLRVLVQA